MANHRHHAGRKHTAPRLPQNSAWHPALFALAILALLVIGRLHGG